MFRGIVRSQQGIDAHTAACTLQITDRHAPALSYQMDSVASTNEEYSTKAYWEKRYAKYSCTLSLVVVRRRLTRGHVAAKTARSIGSNPTMISKT